MSASGVYLELAEAGVRLFIDGDRLFYRAPVGAMTEALRVQVQAHRPELFALLTAIAGKTRGCSPRDHLWGVADLDPARGFVGVLGAAAAGELLGIVHRWETARDRFRPQTDAIEREYWEAWEVIAARLGLLFDDAE